MKKIFSIVAVASMAVIATLSCSKEPQVTTIGVKEDTSIPEVQGIQINSKANSLVIGETLKLEVSVQPETAQAESITWSSSADNVATVATDGTVTAVATGIARITAIMKGKSSSAIINVVGEKIPATDIVLSRKEKATVVGRSFTLTAVLAPENTTDRRDFTWTSSDDKVAIVTDGYVTAVGNGEAIITVSQNNLKATCKVTVGELKPTDMSETWSISSSATWNKNWSGMITGWSSITKLDACDATYHYFAVIKAKEGKDEDLVNEFVNGVESLKEEASDPSKLFSRSVPETRSVSDEGEYIAYVLGFDEELEFDGGYLLFRFTASEPDPVHATGMKFTQGWSNTEITQINLKAGKTLNVFSASLLPEDCTDTGNITFSSTDENVVKLTPYYGKYYNVVAVAEGTAAIKASFKYKDLPEIIAEIPVTVTGSLKLVDCSSSWTYTYGTGAEAFFQLNTCSDPKHVILAMNTGTWKTNASYGYYPNPDSPSSVATWMEDELANDWSSISASSTLPDKYTSTYLTAAENAQTAYVFGIDANGKLTGNYAHWEIDRSVEPGGGSNPDDPGTPDEPATGKVANLDGQFFPYTWSSSEATQNEITMEAWFNASSFSGGSDNIYTIMGTEGVFLLRFEGAQLNLVYGGAKKSNGEYEEKKVTCSSNFSTGEWHHVAATYKNGGSVLLYVDGEQVGSNSAEAHGVELNGVGAQWGLPFKFYVGVSATNRVWKGNLAEVRIWNTVRTASEIKGNMKKSLASGTGLLASWPMNDGSGNTLSDATGNGHTLSASESSNGKNHPAEPVSTNLTWSDGSRPF